MRTDTNEHIGTYLQKLIDERYPSHRQFAIKVLKAKGVKDDPVDIRNMSNRISQIIRGKKSVQIDELPIYADLLGVTCDEILSAGKYHVPTTRHMTNYSVAYSDDPEVWKAYVEREDNLILNNDEYGKTILDYIFEFKNYKLLHYLLQQKIIWFVEESRAGFNYGAGTSIKERNPRFVDIALNNELMEEDQLRIEAITLAIESNDSDILGELRAREVPTLKNAECLDSRYALDKYYNDDLINAVAGADEIILDYFCQQFELEDRWNNRNTFIFPYLGFVVDRMLHNMRNEVELPIRRILNHNKREYEKLKDLVTTAFESGILVNPLDSFKLSAQKDMVSFYCDKDIKTRIFFCTDIIKISGTSKNPLLNDLIKESNDWYDQIINLKETAHE